MAVRESTVRRKPIAQASSKPSGPFRTDQHARELGLKGASDSQIWEAAKASAFDLLITTDRDFLEILAESSPPPKLVRIERADVKTAQLAALLRKYAVAIHAMVEGQRSALILRAR